MQSAPPDAPAWMVSCLHSVARWSASAGHAYERTGDELFDLVPRRVVAAVDGRRLPLTDVARLVLLRRRLGEGWSAVLWLDADVLVFAPEHIGLDGPGEVAACREPWVTGGGAGTLRVVSFVCNAALLARSPGRALDDLLEATVERALAGGTADRSLGPDLLTARHREAALPLLRGVTLFSPHVVRDLAAGGGPAVDLVRTALPEPVGAANLCASTGLGDDVYDAAVAALLATAGTLVNGP